MKLNLTFAVSASNRTLVAPASAAALASCKVVHSTVTWVFLPDFSLISAIASLTPPAASTCETGRRTDERFLALGIPATKTAYSSTSANPGVWVNGEMSSPFQEKSVRSFLSLKITCQVEQSRELTLTQRWRCWRNVIRGS